MKKSMVVVGAVFAAMSFGSLAPVMAADEPVKQEKPAAELRMVRGAITKVVGQTVTVEGKMGDAKTAEAVTFTTTDKTEIVKAKAPYTDPLKVGDRITAKLDANNIAIRIELRPDKAPKGDKKKK